MKRLLFALVSLIPVAVLAANGTMKGAGSEADPWQIADYEDLKAVGTGPYLYGSHYVLTQDIDASASKHEMCDADNSCNGFISIGKKKDAADSSVFRGSLDGKNHTIKNLNIWLPCESSVGFISNLAGSLSNLKFDSLNITGRVSESDYVGVVARSSGPIKNVHVTNGFVQGRNYVGGIVGDMYKPSSYSGYPDNGSLDSVSFQGTVRGRRYVGGIAGNAEKDIDFAKADVHVVVAYASGKSPMYFGGIAGYSNESVSHCRASGMITEDVSVEGILADEVGGLVGRNKGYILGSSATMDIKVPSKSFVSSESDYDEGFDDAVGGLVGYNNGVIHKSYFIGNVEGNSNVGGIAGKNYSQIKYSYSLGSVLGKESVGGIAGYNDDDYASVEYCYTVTAVQGTENAHPVVGENLSDRVVGSYWNTDYISGSAEDVGKGLTSAQMKSLANFDGWSKLSDTSSVVCESKDSPNYQGLWYECDESGLYYEEPQEGKKCISRHLCLSFTSVWSIDEGVGFPYLKAIDFAKVLPVAVPTAAAAWQETPVVAAREDVGYTLFGKWQNWSSLNVAQDSIYHSYIIGYFDGKDTVWGTSSYMAVPNKIEIASLAELKKIGNDPGYPLVANYELTADIDGLNSKFKPIGDSVTPFVGNFNGNNHTISNLIVGEPIRDFSGLFGYVVRGLIENVTLKNIQAEGSWYVGALVGNAYYSVVRNAVSYNGNISGAECVGGLVGYARTTQIEKVAATGKVSGREYVGGVFGELSGSSVEKMYSSNVVRGVTYAGGVVGYSGESSLKEMYSASLVKGRKYLYGIGYEGYLSKDTLSYFDSTLFAEKADEARTTEQMLKQNNYVGWDFENTWTIDEGKSYPYFKGMDPVKPGTLEDDGTICLLLGGGTANDPYLIETYEDLKVVGKYEYSADRYYMLVADISAWASRMENCNADSSICKGFEPIANFSGAFLGAGHGIAYLTLNRTDEDSLGLFKSLAATAKVSNLRLDFAVVNGQKYVGGLAGVDLGADLDSISVKANVKAKGYAGAIAGEKMGGSLEIAQSEGSITAASYAGGLFGNLKKASLKNTFSMASVIGESVLGGLVGNSDSATVANSVAIGKVTGIDKAGGLVGSASKSTWTSAYCDSTLWQLRFTAGGEMKNSAEMVYKSTYENWDFDKVWKITDGLTYPRLVWGKGDLPLIFHHKISILKGSGTEMDPFLIASLEDLASIGYGPYSLSSVYRLTNDIEIEVAEDDYSSDSEFYAIGVVNSSTSFGRGFVDFGPGYVGGEFSGALHGAGHTISNMMVVSDFFNSESYVFIDAIAETGLVDSLYFKNLYSFGDGKSGFTALNRGTIKNVRVEGLFGKPGSGPLVGGEMAAGIATVNVGAISDCYVEGSVGANHVAGGIAAENWGVIENCSTSVDLVGNIYAGGLVGIDRGTIKNSKASGTARSTGIVGGAVGYAEGSIIDRVVADVQVSQTRGPFANDSAGGFVGKNGGRISNSIALGEMTNGCGFAGTNESSGVIAGSYAAGTISDGSGFVGINMGMIRSSYASGDVKIVNSYERFFGGFAGQNIDDGKITDVYSAGSIVFENSPKMPLSEYSMNSLVGDQSATIENAYSIGFVKVDNQAVCSLKNWKKSGSNVYFNSGKCSVPDSVSGIALLTDDQMRHAKNFRNFDFETTWTIDEGVSYPSLLFSLDTAIAKDTTDSKDSTVAKDSTDSKEDSSDSKKEDSKDKDAKDKKESIAGSSVVAGSMLEAVVNGNFAELQFRTTTAGNVNFTLLDMQGRIVVAKNFGNLAAGFYTQTLELENLRNGGYIGVLHVNDRAVERARLVKN